MDITIDGRPLTVDRPVTILEAARLAGVLIPTLCWHPRVSVLGACRLCMVEIEGMNRMLAACTTRVADKMAVRTDTPALRAVRETLLELLLCRHPMDCPTCVKGGACELQALSYRWSAPRNRFPENPGAYPPVSVSPFVERDEQKCVLCRRCVRVCHEVRGVSVLGAMHRGHLKEIGTYFSRPLDSDFQDPYNCEFCGACIDICPVGALNSRQHKFRARSWEGERAASICPFCSVGCRLELQVKENELVQARPLRGPNNEDQACFRGRFAVDHVNAPERVRGPLVRRDGELRPASRAEAVAVLRERLRPETPAMALLSPALTQEEGADVVDFMAQLFPRGTVRAVCSVGLNASDLPLGVGGRPWDDLGGADLVLVAGQDFTPFSPVAGVRIRLARRASGARLALIDGRDTLLGAEADLWLRPPGSFVGHVLAALGKVLSERHPERLRAQPDAHLAAVFAAVDPAAVERLAGLAEGAIARLAELVAAAQTPVFVSHRGWYDAAGQAPRLLAEIDRLLAGAESRGIIYLRSDCNSRGASELVAASDPESDGEPEALLVVGADPLGTALPGTPFERWTREARFLVVVDSFLTATAREADVVLPLPAFAEKGGTFTASNNLAQSFGPALAPPEGVPQLRETLADLAAVLGRSVAFAGPAGGRELRWTPPERPEVPPPPPEAGRMLVLHGSPFSDERVRVVPEAARLAPGAALEVHPEDLAGLGLAPGGRARLVSGEAALTVPVRADRRTPPGQLHLPVDPHAAEVAAFARAARRLPGWSPCCVALDALEPAAGEG